MTSQTECNSLLFFKTGHPTIMNITNYYGQSQMEDDCISKVRVATLEDYDVTSCYDVINTADTFVLDRRGAQNNISNIDQLAKTQVNITTYNMKCSDSFHFVLYQEQFKSTDCGSENGLYDKAYCTILSDKTIEEQYTQCMFECNCPPELCPNLDILYLRVSHPMEGGLCDITMALTA